MPFDLSVLLAKVQAALRRAYDYQGQSHLLEHNGALFSSLECSVTYEGKKVELTKNETRMMQVLLENKPNVVSRDTLMPPFSSLSYRTAVESAMLSTAVPIFKFKLTTRRESQSPKGAEGKTHRKSICFPWC